MLPTYYRKNQLNVGTYISPMYPMGMLGGFEKPFGSMAPLGAASRAWPWSGRPKIGENQGPSQKNND